MLPAMERGRDEGDPRGSLDVEPVALRDPKGGRRSALAVLAGVIAVIAVGIGAAGLLGPGQAPARVPPTAQGAPPAPGGTAGIPPSATVAAAPTAAPTASPKFLVLPAVTDGPDPLLAAVRAGSAEGRLVLVEGHLETIPLPCASSLSTLHTCVLLAIEGMDLKVAAGAAQLPWPGDPPADAALVLRVLGHGLVYLGWLDPSTPVLPGLAPEDAGHAIVGETHGRPGELVAADGWLVAEGVHSCPAIGPGATPCPGPDPFLAADPPLEGGLLRSNRGAHVALDPALDLGARVVTAGPVLAWWPTAAQCDLALAAHVCLGAVARRWVVAAAYDPVATLRVRMP